jgi:Transglycosylase SLT domain
MYNLRMFKLILTALFILYGSACIAEESIWKKASTHSGVPEAKIYAIALEESKLMYGDKKMRPWPWTVNSPSGPERFRNKSAAYKRIQELVDYGVTNIDIGMMQINYRYHKDLIGKQDVLDPKVNVMIAAEILRQKMIDAKGDARKAVAFYHSHNEILASEYDVKIRRNESQVASFFK